MYKDQQSNTPVHIPIHMCGNVQGVCVKSRCRKLIQYECLQKITNSSAPLDGAQVEHEQFPSSSPTSTSISTRVD